MSKILRVIFAANLALLLFVANTVLAADEPAPAKKAPAKKTPPAPRVELVFPPTLPDGQQVVTVTTPAFLQAPETLQPDVTVAKTAPTVDFLYYPGQDYLGNPWSNWGDSLAVNGKYYSAIGDHLAANRKDLSHGTGTAYLTEYDPEKKSLKVVCDVAKVLNLHAGHYTPGKIHSRIDLGSDGCLYFATHRGSTTVTTDQYHYAGDWIFRYDPKTGKTEVVVQGPVAKHCIPNSVLDPERLIFYGGTASGEAKEGKDVRFFAYDLKNRKLLYAGEDGPARYMIFARSTGKLYYVPGGGDGELLSYEPKPGVVPTPVKETLIGVRAATQETPQHKVFTVSTGQGGKDAQLYSFDTKTEKVEQLGSAIAGSQQYIASIDADPTGRYLYYVPGAHGGSDRDNGAVVQYDTRTKKKKVVAFLSPYFQDKYGCTLKGTYGTAVDESGERVYITWNANRGSKAWDCCVLTVVHIPAAERAE
jgi:hypothetical protein